MIIVAFENSANFVLTIGDKLSENYQKSSIAKITKYDKTKEVVARFKRPPLFNDGWFLRCDPRVSISLIKELEETAPKNRIFIRVTSAKESSDVREKLKGLEFIYVDNFIPERSLVIDWVVGELNCSTTIANSIYDRCGGRLTNIMNAVGLLSSLKTITENDVRRCSKKDKSYSVHDLFLWIIGCQKKFMTRSDAIQVVYDYRFASKWLIEYLIGELDTYIEVYSSVLKGDLSLLNFREVRDTTTSGAINKLTEWQLKRMLEQFETVSLEYIIYIRELLGSLNKKNKLVNNKLIKIIELGG